MDTLAHRHKQMLNTWGVTLKLIGAMVALMLAGSTFASSWQFTAGVNAGETYSNNVALASREGAKGDWITEITPIFTVVKTSGRLKMNAHYSLQKLFYDNDRYLDKTYHKLDAIGNAELYKKEIFLDASASTRQVSTTPFNPTGADNKNATGNISNVRTLTISPYWVHHFGSVAVMNSRFGLSEVDYNNAFVSNSINTASSLALSSGTAFRLTPWSINYSNQKVNYTNRSNVEFTTASASLGYLVTPRIKLAGVTGYERNQYLHTGSAPEGGFWEGNMSWAVSPRTKFEVGLSGHYYGRTKFLLFTTHGGHLEWKAEYNESVMTSNSQGIYPTYLVASGGKPIWIFADTAQIQTDSVFLNKRFQTELAWKRGRNAITANVYHSSQVAQEVGQLSYLYQNGALQGANSVKKRGVSAAWHYQLTLLVSANLSVNLLRSSYPGLAREDKDTNVQLSINRKLSSRMNGSINARRQARNSNQNEVDYTENALSTMVVYTF